MAQIIRWAVSDYLNVGSESAKQWALMGTGFNTIDENPAAQVKETTYVSDKSTTNMITGYKPVFPFDTDIYSEEEAVMKLYDIGRNHRTGKDAQVEYLRTDFTVDEDGTPITNVVDARKFKVSVEVATIEGAGGENMRITGNLNGVGDFVDGTFDLINRVFTPSTPATDELVVTSTAGTTIGKTKITVTPALTGTNTYVYMLTVTELALPAAGTDLSGLEWIPWDGTAEITAESGYFITVAEIDTTDKCVKSGETIVVSKEA